MQPLIRFLGTACLALALAAPAALGLTIGDSHDLGLISKNFPADPTSSAGFIDILLDQPLNSGPVTIGANSYTRTANNPLSGLYPDAVFDVDLGATTTIHLDSGDLYLLAKYDGPNWGSEVWYVGDLTGTITIPQYSTKNKKYAVSHVYIYSGASTAGRSVPDSGSTAILLGAAFAGLAFFRRSLPLRRR